MNNNPRNLLDSIDRNSIRIRELQLQNDRDQDRLEEYFDQDGYNQHGYGRDGYDRDGYGHDGYDRSGFDNFGYGRDGYDRNGYNDRGGIRGRRDGYYPRDSYLQTNYHRDNYRQQSGSRNIGVRPAGT